LVAGIKSNKYRHLDKNVEFLRAMPNTSSKHGLGITAVFNSTFKKSNLKKVIGIMKKVGIVITVDSESKIDAFTGIIGSGPAYFFHLLQSYEKKLLTLSNGDKKVVNKIMSNLMKGVGMSIEKDTNLDNLIKAVASKKGTTEAGLKSFKLNKLSNRFEKGLNAAIKRSKEISNEF
jgi:pyrroline-5-carboxylate reductase